MCIVLMIQFTPLSSKNTTDVFCFSELPGFPLGKKYHETALHDFSWSLWTIITEHWRRSEHKHWLTALRCELFFSIHRLTFYTAYGGARQHLKTIVSLISVSEGDRATMGVSNEKLPQKYTSALIWEEVVRLLAFNKR